MSYLNLKNARMSYLNLKNAKMSYLNLHYDSFSAIFYIIFE